MTHLSLFSGIGGLDLAAEWAGFRTVGQCEWADFPTRVLEKHWPDVARWRDIHDLSADEFIWRTGIRPGELTCVSGGFPCQPHSVAGLRKASCDERDMWPEYRRVIGDLRPKWVVAENVRGLLSSESGWFFRGILRDISKLGYDAGWCSYRAADVGAVHSRERVFIIAYARSERLRAGSSDRKERYIPEEQKGDAEKNKPERYGRITWANQDIKAHADTNRQYMERDYKGQIQRERELLWCTDAGDLAEWTRRCNIFEPKLLRNYHGTPNGVDRIKSLGNMVVPQQAYLIFQAIADIESGWKSAFSEGDKNESE